MVHFEISKIEKAFFGSRSILAVNLDGYELKVFPFEMNRLTFAEGVDRPLNEGASTSNVFIPVLKSSLWISGGLFEGGPFAWRIPSFVSSILFKVIEIGESSVVGIVFDCLKGIGIFIVVDDKYGCSLHDGVVKNNSLIKFKYVSKRDFSQNIILTGTSE